MNKIKLQEDIYYYDFETLKNDRNFIWSDRLVPYIEKGTILYYADGCYHTYDGSSVPEDIIVENIKFEILENSDG